MTDSHYVAAYWGPRRESASACAERLAPCLQELAEISPILGGWRKRGRRRRDAMRETISLDVPTLTELMLAGRNHRDTDGEPIENLGFRVGGWNAQENAAGFSSGCGNYSEVPGLGNSFLIDLPEPEGEAAAIYRAETAERVARAIIDSWSPDWLTWASDDMRSWQPREPGRPVVGWLTYFQHAYTDRLALGRLPDGVHLLDTATGILIKIGDHPLSVRDDMVRATAAAINPKTKWE